jgi:hypothetical protein
MIQMRRATIFAAPVCSFACWRGAAEAERAFRCAVWGMPWGRQQTVPLLLRALRVVQADVRAPAALASEESSQMSGWSNAPQV